MLLCTNVLMPLFSRNTKRFMVENFGQYLGDGQTDGSNSLATLQVLGRPGFCFSSC